MKINFDLASQNLLPTVKCEVFSILTIYSLAVPTGSYTLKAILWQEASISFTWVCRRKHAIALNKL